MQTSSCAEIEMTGGVQEVTISKCITGATLVQHLEQRGRELTGEPLLKRQPLF